MSALRFEVTVLYLCQDMFPPLKYSKSISRNAHYIVAFKNPREQLRMRNLLLQAFPTCLQDMMDVYQKVTERGSCAYESRKARVERKHIIFQQWSSTLLISYFQAIYLIFNRPMTSRAISFTLNGSTGNKIQLSVCIYRSRLRREQTFVNKIVTKMIKKKYSAGGCRWL